MVGRFLAVVAALPAVVLLIAGPIHELAIDPFERCTDTPGIISHEQGWAVTAGLIVLAFALASVIVARWSGASPLQTAAAVVLAAPLTLCFARLVAYIELELLDSSVTAHPPVLGRYAGILLYSAFHLVVVVIFSNLFVLSAPPAAPAVATGE